MQIKKSESGALAISGTIESAGVPQDTLVTITGDNQFDVADSGDVPVGYVSVPAKDDTETDADVTVEVLRFRRVFEAKCSGAITAGTQVKMANHATGNVSVVADLSTGDRKLMVGICIVGAGDGETGTFLGY